MKKNKVSGVYGIFCNKIRSVYVGWSGDVNGIIRTHKMRLKKGVYRDGEKYYAIQQDWDKYGEDSFKMYVLEETENKLAVGKWLSKLDKDGMNIRNVGGITEKGAGYPYPEERKGVHDQLESMLERGVVDVTTMPKYLNQIEELVKG